MRMPRDCHVIVMLVKVFTTKLLPYTALSATSIRYSVSDVQLHPIASTSTYWLEIWSLPDKSQWALGVVEEKGAKMKISLLGLPAFLPAALAASSAPAYPAHHVPLPVANHSSATNASIPSFTFDELFQLQKKFLDEFIYPENQVQVRSSPRLNPTSHRITRQQRG